MYYSVLKEIKKSKSIEKRIQKSIRVWNTFKGNAPARRPLRNHAFDVFSSSPELYQKSGAPFHGFVETDKGILRWTGKIEYCDEFMNIPSNYTPFNTECFYTCWMTDLFNPAISASFQTIMFEKMRDYKFHKFILQTEHWDRYVELAQNEQFVADNICVKNIELESMRNQWKNKRRNPI